MCRIRHSLCGCAVVFGLVSCFVAAAPAPALADTHPLQLTVIGAQLNTFTCLNSSCSLAALTGTGDVTSNVSTGAGTYQSNLVIDFSPGGSCNIVDESDVLTFGNGTIAVSSHHEDCATHGLRIDGTFQVTGGTGDFQGATGGGREFSSTGAASPVIYQGTISF
jgi:hypothetical protein